MKSYPGLDLYLRKNIDSVAGYLTTLDAETIAALGKFQTANDVAGDLCELGVHHGRLFFILAHLRQPGEKALPVDLFLDGDGNDNDTHRGRDKAFFNNSKRMNIDLDDVLTANTQDLSPKDLLDRINKARIISVDAGHLHDEVANDLELARAILTDDGVIIADDYFNIYWPGVTTATNAFIAEPGDFAPFLITSGKLYICRKDKLELYEKFAREVAAMEGVSSRMVDMNGMPLLAVRMGQRAELKRKLRKWF
jgi:hypothetical protein